MLLRIISVGRLREKYWQDSVADYMRRLRPYARLETIEVPEARVSDGATTAEGAKAMAQEGEAILEKIKKREGPVIVLDRQGQALDSIELAAWLEGQLLQGNSDLAWVIGGPLGIAPSVLERADLVLSFSRMTFPHQMMRLILLEQIYRSFRIMRNEPYHK